MDRKALKTLNELFWEYLCWQDQAEVSGTSPAAYNTSMMMSPARAVCVPGVPSFPLNAAEFPPLLVSPYLCCQLKWLKLFLLWLRITISIISGFINETLELKCCSQDRTPCLKSPGSHSRDWIVCSSGSIFVPCFLNVGKANAKTQE